MRLGNLQFPGAGTTTLCGCGDVLEQLPSSATALHSPRRHLVRREYKQPAVRGTFRPKEVGASCAFYHVTRRNARGSKCLNQPGLYTSSCRLLESRMSLKIILRRWEQSYTTYKSWPPNLVKLTITRVRSTMAQSVQCKLKIRHPLCSLSYAGNVLFGRCELASCELDAKLHSEPLSRCPSTMPIRFCKQDQALL